MIFKFLVELPKLKWSFLNCLTFLYHQNKQIVITSDKPASELKNIMPRLTSRFEAGLAVDIKVPDLEHRIEIFETKT